jgi:hypothetical protein
LRLEPARAPDEASPVVVGAARDDSCPRCGEPETTLLDLDLRDARLDFLGVRGTRLRIPTCTACWSTSFSRFDGSGNARSIVVGSDDDDDHDGEPAPPRPTPMLLVPGRTPVEPCLGDMHAWIGGHPDWIDDADYPDCPACGRSMMFVAQVDLDALDGVGMRYAFLCAPCQMAATFARCT